MTSAVGIELDDGISSCLPFRVEYKASGNYLTVKIIRFLFELSCGSSSEPPFENVSGLLRILRSCKLSTRFDLNRKSLPAVIRLEENCILRYIGFVALFRKLSGCSFTIYPCISPVSFCRIISLPGFTGYIVACGKHTVTFGCICKVHR